MPRTCQTSPPTSSYVFTCQNPPSSLCPFDLTFASKSSEENREDRASLLRKKRHLIGLLFDPTWIQSNGRTKGNDGEGDRCVCLARSVISIFIMADETRLILKGRSRLILIGEQRRASQKKKKTWNFSPLYIWILKKVSDQMNKCRCLSQTDWQRQRFTTPGRNQSERSTMLCGRTLTTGDWINEWRRILKTNDQTKSKKRQELIEWNEKKVFLRSNRVVEGQVRNLLEQLDRFVS